MMAAIATAIFPAFFMILYMAVIIYFVWLAGRFVRAIEKIADKIENIHASTKSENLR